MEQTCPLCSKTNRAEEKFCTKCRYPLSVKRLKDYSRDDVLLCLQDLFVATKKKAHFKDHEIQQLYDEFFNLYWLRPESAVFRFLEAAILLRFRKTHLKYPMLDAGCGDGLFSYILFGGRIDAANDNFGQIDCDKVDIYDCLESQEPLVGMGKAWSGRLGWGVDIKENSVRKAQNLKAYDGVKVGDLRNLPFGNDCMASVFSNMMNDIQTKELHVVLQEIRRVLQPQGYFLFTSPNERFHSYLYYFNKALECQAAGDWEEQEKWMEFDRGRSLWEGRSLDFWKNILEKQGFVLSEEVHYAGKKIIAFWDTGFRPFFPVLHAIRNQLKEQSLLLPVKSIVVDMLKEYFFDLCETSLDDEGAFTLYVVQKK